MVIDNINYAIESLSYQNYILKWPSVRKIIDFHEGLF